MENPSKASPLTANLGDVAEHHDRTENRSEGAEPNVNSMDEGTRRVSEEFRSRADRIADQYGQKAREMASQFNKHAGPYYSEARDWMSNNYGKALVAVGILGAIGIAGYLIARNRNERFEGSFDRELA